MVDCLFIASGLCWKSTTQLSMTSGGSNQTLWTSGNCIACLIGMEVFGYHKNHIPTMRNGTELLSGAHVQFNL